MYKHTALVSLIGAVAIGIVAGSVVAGAAFFVLSILYHSQFIARRQSIVARFWGEGGQGGGRMFLLWIAQWTLYAAMAVLAFTVAGVMRVVSTADRSEAGAVRSVPTEVVSPRPTLSGVLATMTANAVSTPSPTDLPKSNRSSTHQSAPAKRHKP